MIAPDRRTVIGNIQACVSRNAFNNKVETGDPVLDEEGARRTLYRIVKHRESIPYGIKNFVARRVADTLAYRFNKATIFMGMERLSAVKGAAIVTSNHFAPFENTILRIMASKAGRGPLRAVSQDTNFAMKGWMGFMLRYTDLIPVSHDQGFMSTFFEPMLADALAGGHFVLMYPEQEMWFNYRKPRPLKRGAYHYAAKFGVPVVSCFVQIDDLPGVGNDGMGRIRCTLHVLDPIFPDSDKSVRENSILMMRQDYAQKREAYERAYGKPLDYTFENWDIAGYEQGLRV